MKALLAALALFLVVASATAACVGRPAGELPDMESTLDAAAVSSAGGEFRLEEAIDRPSWDRVVVFSCGTEAATTEVLGFPWTGLSWLLSSPDLCDFEREVDAILVVDGREVVGWGTVNADDDGTHLGLEVLLPASIARQDAVFEVSLDAECLSNCPAYRLRPSSPAG